MDQEPRQADPLEAKPPTFSLVEGAAIARRLFGVTGTASSLDSERDQNVRITPPTGESFVLKISNPADAPEVIDMQTQAQLHIARRDPALPVMLPLPTIDGDLQAVVEGAGGEAHLVRLFNLLPGKTVKPVELDAAGLRGFGSLVGCMGVALRGFFHSAGGYEILWDLKHSARLRRWLNTIPDPSRRAVAERVLDRFDARVGSALHELRSQLIHNDLTLDNVLLDDSYRVSGIIDFGDLTHSALICDLAIALVSVMWGRPDPLEAAENAIAGYGSVVSVEAREADLLADLVSARLAALVVIAGRRVARYPENAEYITANVDLAWELLEEFEAMGLSSVRDRMRAACLGMSPPVRRPPIGDLLDRRRRRLGPALSPLAYDRPLYLVRGEGCWMFDHEDRAYLDAYNNVPIVGHCHPRVAEAIAEQSRMLNTNTRYLHESVVELAERVVATMPDELDTVMFVNSGSEANDIAWRLATAYTDGNGAIVTEHAYHGVTTATIALSPEQWATGEQPNHVERVPVPSRPDHHEDTDWAIRHARRVDEAGSVLAGRGFPPAAFFVDSTFTSDGIFTPPPSYLEEVARRAKRAGYLVVADEVQAGFGRTGSHLWSFQRSEMTPDFVTLGKPMGNGHPIAAVVTRSEIADHFAQRTDMFSTFGGNPVACRAALAVLDVLRDEALQERAADLGAYLRAGLDRLMERHISIGEVRGAGLMIGVELVETGTRWPGPRLARAVMNSMKDKGVLVGATGRRSNVLKIRPPLVLTPPEADLILEALDASLTELCGPEGA